MEQNIVLPHERIDAVVAKIAGWCEHAFSKNEGRATIDESADVAFSDAWERTEITRELHLN
jgi:hypothetical protein